MTDNSLISGGYWRKIPPRGQRAATIAPWLFDQIWRYSAVGGTTMTTAAETPAAPDLQGRWTRDLVAYGLMMLCVAAVHFMVAGKLKSPEQEAVFAWSGLALIGAAGLAGVVFTRLAGLRGLWDADLGLGEKLWKPLLFGLIAGG